MNALATTNPRTDVAAGVDVSFTASANAFAAMTQMASVLADSLILPDTLRMDPKTNQELPRERRIANAVLIVNQARIWDCDPLALAQGVSLIYGKLMYEGKVIAGIVNSRAGLAAPLDVTYSGEGESRSATISGRLARDPGNVRSVTVVWSKVRTMSKGQVSQQWKDDPDQMLWYRGVRQWARKHAPSVLLGVAEDYTELEADRSAYVDAAEQPKLPSSLNEEHYRKEIVDAVTMWHVDFAADQMEESDLEEHRKARLRELAQQCRAKISADRLSARITSLESLDFADAAAVAKWTTEVRENKDIIQTDREKLRGLFAARKKDYESNSKVSLVDEFLGRIEACDFADQKAGDILLKDIETSSLPDDAKARVIEAYDKEAAKLVS